jgi:serine/threonine-protein kinase
VSSQQPGSAAPPDPFEQRIGTLVGGTWKLLRLIGVGGMAAVYAAEHPSGRRDAIKILHPEVARDADARARFQQEARAANHLQHPRAVRIHDIGTTTDGCPFLVMELIEGESLAARQRRGQRMPHAEILRLVDELLDVLAAAHGRGIVHRDIKPDNLFLRPDGELKVLDFGIARLRTAGTHVRTRTGVTLGTPSYMSPEQVKGVDVDHRTDLFAVGAVMFELVSGRFVHEAKSEQEIMLKMLTVPARALASVAPDAPADLCLIVDRALAFEIADRYPDAATMQGDVRALRAGRPPPYVAAGSPKAAAAIPAASVTVVPASRAPWLQATGHLQWILLGVVCLVLLVIALAIAVSSGDDETDVGTNVATRAQLPA